MIINHFEKKYSRYQNASKVLLDTEREWVHYLKQHILFSKTSVFSSDGDYNVYLFCLYGVKLYYKQTPFYYNLRKDEGFD